MQICCNVALCFCILKSFESNAHHLLLANPYTQTHTHTHPHINSFSLTPLICSPALIVTQVWKKHSLDAHPWPPLQSSPRHGHTLVAPSTPTPAPFAMDVSKPSDLAVLTGGYFRTGMAKPSATGNGHWKKTLEKIERLQRGRACRGEWRILLCMCVCNMFICVWVCSQPYNWPSGVLGSHVADGHRDCCWNWRFHTLAKPRRRLKFFLWQLAVVSLAFHPHHYQHLAFIKTKICCFLAHHRSKPFSWWFKVCADLQQLADTWFIPTVCPAYGNIKINVSTSI